MTRRFFGTDGIRGRVGESPITPELVLKLGWAAGRVLCKQGSGEVLIGKDTRISGYLLESALEAGLAAAGANILLLGPMPTPAIAYLTRTFHASAGIVISASHNPYYDNGIKFFSSNGSKLPDDVEHAIEAEMDKPFATVDSARIGKASRIEDAAGRYIEFCKSTVHMNTTFSGMKVVLDCANGATYQIAPRVFTELGATVVTYANIANGLNINEDCGSTRPEKLQEAVLRHKADVGIALDGDGDRVIMVDHTGELVDGDELLYIIAESRLIHEQLNGSVVGTVMSNFGLEKALNDLGISFIRVPVGDRYIMETLRQGGWMLGGEASGHIICLDRTTTGDGIVAALQVLAAIVTSGRSLHELKSGMVKYPQTLLNVRLPANIATADRLAILDDGAVQATLKDVESELNGKGRVLLRPSGTEPLLRVMVEGRDAGEVEGMARRLAKAVSDVVASR